MTYTKGYPDVILGFWRGWQKDGQQTDDDSITETIKTTGEWGYKSRIVKLGPLLKAAGFKLGEVVGWSNPTDKPGFYSYRTKARSGGVPFFIEGMSEMLSHDKSVGRSLGRPPLYSYRVESPVSSGSSTRPSEKDPCNHLKENLTWLYGVKDDGRDAVSFLLNPSSKESQISEPIVKLSNGEIYNFRFRVVGVKTGGGNNHGIEINFNGGSGSGWIITFQQGKDIISGALYRLNGNLFHEKNIDISWYKPGLNNIVILKYCRNGEFRLSINNHSIGRYFEISGELTIYVGVQGMDVVFDKN